MRKLLKQLAAQLTHVTPLVQVHFYWNCLNMGISLGNSVTHLGVHGATFNEVHGVNGLMGQTLESGFGLI